MKIPVLLCSRHPKLGMLMSTMAPLTLSSCLAISSLQTASAAQAQTHDQSEAHRNDPAAAKLQAGSEVSQPLSPKQIRAAQIDADTERLLQLAGELKAELDKSGKDTLSLQVVRKATEVEKLAKSLKDRLKRE